MQDPAEESTDAPPAINDTMATTTVPASQTSKQRKNVFSQPQTEKHGWLNGTPEVDGVCQPFSAIMTTPMITLPICV